MVLQLYALIYRRNWLRDLEIHSSIKILPMANKTSQHILNTAANLLGFCLFVITSLHISSYSVSSMIDELTSVMAILLIFSCLFSFFSI